MITRDPTPASRTLFPLRGQPPQHYSSSYGTTTKFRELRVIVCPELERAIGSERWFQMTHTVLLVDDDPAVLDVIASMLEEIGCRVIRANGGAEALDLLQHHDRISILITDINMPSMDGHELAERATRLRPALKVLQLSGRERRRDGFPMIRKPFSEDDLYRVMQQTTGAC
jgi:two-component system cell cycle response regulator CpdR